MMSQPDIQKLICKAQAIRGNSNSQQPRASQAMEVAVKPSANLLEILHARKLRDTVAQQVLRLEEQSCAVSWSVDMAEFEPLYCDPQQQPMRDPLNADEVRSHYVDLLVAMDHLLVQLGDAPSER